MDDEKDKCSDCDNKPSISIDCIRCCYEPFLDLFKESENKGDGK